MIIYGATASGKSDFAMRYASCHNGEIVSADSMQIYRGMDIGTAKPSVQDRQNIAHHCIDIVQPNQSFSVASWVQFADLAILDILKRNKLPIIVGGTGLYIKGLLYKHDYVDSDPKIREELETQLQQKGSSYLYQKLYKVDNISATMIGSNDTKRLIRALEIYMVTGKPKSQFTISAIPRYQYQLHEISLDRVELYKRIDKRVDDMIKYGLVQEVETMLPYRNCQSMQGIGYRQLLSYFDGVHTLEQCISQIKQATRNYAKRQLTFFRHQIS